MFLYCTVSTLNPIVGMVCTISPICSRYRIVVLPLRVASPQESNSQHRRQRLEPRPTQAERARPRRCGFGRLGSTRAEGGTHAESSPSINILTSDCRENSPDSLENRDEKETPTEQ